MKRLDRWLFAPGTAEQLAALRIGLCAILALRLTRTVYVRLSEQPAALFEPRSFMNLFDRMPPRGVVLTLQVLGIATAVLAAYGWRARITLPIAWTCGVFLGAMTTSLGKIVHNDVMLMLAMVPLLFAPVSDAWSLDARRRGAPPPSPRYGSAWRGALVVVTGGYAFAGLAKLINSGSSWAFSENMRWVLYTSSDSQAVPNSLALFVADRPWLASAIAVGTLVLEIGSIAVLWSARARPWFAAGAVALHGGIWMAMRLNYWPQAATAVVVLLDWPAIVARARARRGVPAPASPP